MRAQSRTRKFAMERTAPIVSSNRATVAVLILSLPLAGCNSVLDPQGPVGQSQRLILIDSVAVMLVIVVPVILATIGFAWWFRASNERAVYWPDWAFSGHLELIVWAIPALVITFLGGIAWYGSHALDPFLALASKTPALEVEVVSLDWKWLFIYPDEGVAAVNQLVIPTGRPVRFRLSSSGIMNSFFVPQLGSQMYTMPGMISQLNLQADHEGTYPGLSAQFSGQGFSDMRFDVRAVTPDAFAKWVADTKSGTGGTLDKGAYRELAKPSENVAPSTYPAVEKGLFDAIVNETTQGAPGSRSGSNDPARLPWKGAICSAS